MSNAVEPMVKQIISGDFQGVMPLLDLLRETNDQRFEPVVFAIRNTVNRVREIQLRQPPSGDEIDEGDEPSDDEETDLGIPVNPEVSIEAVSADLLSGAMTIDQARETLGIPAPEGREESILQTVQEQLGRRMAEETDRQVMGQTSSLLPRRFDPAQFEAMKQRSYQRTWEDFVNTMRKLFWLELLDRPLCDIVSETALLLQPAINTLPKSNPTEKHL